MKKFFLGTLALIMSVALFAAPRTAEQAAEIAAEFTNAQPQLSRMHKAPRTAATMKLAHTALKPASDEAAYYVFNQENNGGAVFISADDRTLDVLGYTVSGQFNPETVNPNLKWWLERYAKEIANVNDENAYPVSAVRKAQQVTAIAPLLKDKNGKEITWDQESPYWNLCPTDCGGTSLTGCVATAASQIMFSWRWPVKGTGKKTYTWNQCTSGFWGGYCIDDGTPTTLSADFGNTTYDWDNMLPAYAGKSSTSAQKTAVATLMKHAGVACEMYYSSKGSGAWTDDMGAGLRDYFGYKLTKFICTYSKSKYESAKSASVANIPYEFGITAAKMAEYFNADLEAGRPILMGGDSQTSGGHEFVCNGRDSSGKFYINWGWEGDDNGYFSLTSLNPSGYNFSENMDAIIGLEPDNAEPVAVTGVSVSPTEATIKVYESKQLTATVAPAEATEKEVTWSSSDDAVATVTSTGLVKGVSEGTATITVTTKDGGFTADCDITVSGEMEFDPNFVLLTDISFLSEKDDIIFVCEAKNVAAGLTLTAASTATYMVPVAVTITDKTIELDDETTDVAILTVGGTTDAWTLTNQKGKQLGATAAKKLAWDKGTQTWKISLEDGNSASINSTNSDYGRMYYNVSFTRFCNYTSNPSTIQLLPQIYIRKHKDKPAAVENAQDTKGTTKRIENGQLVIIVNGIKYNVFGQTIE